MSHLREIPGVQTEWFVINQLLELDERFAVEQDGWKGCLFAPKTLSKLSALLYRLSELHLPYCIQGKGSQEKPLVHSVIVSVRAFSRFDWMDDEVLGVEAGSSLHLLQSELTQARLELGLEEWIWENGKRTVGSAIIQGCHSGLILRQREIKERLLGLELVKPDGGIVRLGRPLKSACAGPSLHRLFWGIEQTDCVLTKAYFRVEACPQKRWTLAWRFEDRPSLWNHLHELKTFCQSWERLDCVIPGHQQEKAILLAQISGSEKEMEEFKALCPLFTEANDQNLLPILKEFFQKKGFSFIPVKEMDDMKFEEYLWYHSLINCGWLITQRSIPQVQSIPLWQQQLFKN
jgi:FAD/FMN-containing dehydrogenase